MKDCKKGSISCNRIVVQDVTTGKMDSHNFRITNEVKNVSIKQMVQIMYNREFNESKVESMEGMEKRTLKKSHLKIESFLR